MSQPSKSSFPTVVNWRTTHTSSSRHHSATPSTQSCLECPTAPAGTASLWRSRPRTVTSKSRGSFRSRASTSKIPSTAITSQVFLSLCQRSFFLYVKGLSFSVSQVFLYLRISRLSLSLMCVCVCVCVCVLSGYLVCLSLSIMSHESLSPNRVSGFSLSQ